MFFPEQLFQLRPGESAYAYDWLTPYLRSTEITSAAQNPVVPVHTVPADRSLVLQHALLTGFDPTAAETVQSAAIVVLNQAGSQVCHLSSLQIASRSAMAFTTWQGSLVIPPTWQIVGIIGYSAGAVAKTSRLSVGGMMILAGNVQRS